jgi:outer membrane protein assembly factor BamB
VIYAGTVFGPIYAVNPDGTLRWKGSSQDIVGVQGRSPAIGSDGTVYYCSPYRYVNAAVQSRAVEPAVAPVDERRAGKLADRVGRVEVVHDS